MTFLDKLIRQKEVIIFGGGGGVGKTTLAAAVALHAAVEGRKTLVMTIDPAKRLADSLGVRSLGNEEREVSLDELSKNGTKPKGQLFALMLDPKKTFDDMVRKFAPRQEVVDRIFGNRLYQQITTTLAGMYEYTAIEKLYELHQAREYDLIVVDTPPTKHALEFLEAPNRLVEFFQSGVVRWFLRPYVSIGKLGFKLVERGADLLFKIFEGITGFSIVRDVSEFFMALEDIWEGLAFRAKESREQLEQDSTAFVLVSSPHQQNVKEVLFYHEKLREARIPFGGFVVNRFHFPYLPKKDRRSLLDDTERAIEEHLSKSSQPKYRRLLENLRAIEDLSDYDQRGVDLIREEVAKSPIVCVPALPTDVYSLPTLHRLATHLFGNNGKDA
ncbi:MAG: ArsA family ATPase [Nitrospirae bacterium]|nr:ArsA family ATPase [Nitrospirota bacterium]